MSHTCHAHGCATVVPPRLFACRRHWFALSKNIRDAIWREYRPGQENDKEPSLRYLAVQQFACAYLAFKERVEWTPPYLVKALMFREMAMSKGLGDPLDGLLQDVERLRGERK
jgi:hypothetical protein